MILKDIAIGLLIATLCSLAGFQSGCVLVVAALAGSILPDWDMGAYLLFGGKLDQFAHHHRDISHYPLITIPIVASLVFRYIGMEYAIVVGIAMLYHYVADSFSVGWGVMWGFPFCFLYIAYRAIGAEKPRFHAWTKKEQDHVAKLFGDPQWTKNSRAWKWEIILFGCSLVFAYVHFSFKC